MRGRQRITLLGGKSVLQENKDRKQQVRTEIQNEDANQILNTPKDDYVEYILSEYGYGRVNINLDDAELDVEDYSADANASIIIPVRGEVDVLKYDPQSSRMKSYQAEVIPSAGDKDVYELHIDLPHPGTRRGWNKERVDKAASKVTEYIEDLWPNLEGDFEQFESQLETYAADQFEKRRKEAREQREAFGNSKFPLRKRDDTPETFSIKPPDRREKIELPEVKTDTASDPVPTVPDGTYQDILQAIHDIGNGFQQSPGLFRDYGEEDLRDFVRVFLEMNFESGTATAETFNKEGKTDILLKAADGTNVFVAECAFWSGKSKFQDKIDQLFGYLTWTDSKAAVVLFVDQQEMETIAGRIEEGAEEYDPVGELEDRVEKGWWQYTANFPDDPEREIDLAVLAFHIPAE